MTAPRKLASAQRKSEIVKPNPEISPVILTVVKILPRRRVESEFYYSLQIISGSPDR